MIRHFITSLLLLIAISSTSALNSEACAQEQSQTPVERPALFNNYILKAVDYLNAKFGLLGYDITGVLTHNIAYLNLGTIPATKKGKTMCVAAQMETMLTAMQIYTSETKDTSPFYYLPLRSWEGLTRNDIRGHIWVNSSFQSNGGADALRNFGMGARVPFENLQSGSFINLNRNQPHPTGHAVVFLAFIDINGNEFATYNSSVAGFKYFSSQGHNEPGQGGFGFRDAIFDGHACPAQLPFQHDCHIIYSKKQVELNTGMMWAPHAWKHTALSRHAKETADQDDRNKSPEDRVETQFNSDYYNGETAD